MSEQTAEERIEAIRKLVFDYGDLSFECGEFEEADDEDEAISNLAAYSIISDRAAAKMTEVNDALNALGDQLSLARRENARAHELIKVLRNALPYSTTVPKVAAAFEALDAFYAITPAEAAVTNAGAGGVPDMGEDTP